MLKIQVYQKIQLKNGGIYKKIGCNEISYNLFFLPLNCIMNFNALVDCVFLFILARINLNKKNIYAKIGMYV